MTKAREQHVSLDVTPYYHCVSRCVRRAFLCGFDRASGEDFEHRRGWIERRILELQAVFCIDVCAYAVMSNHYHVVLHVDVELNRSLSDLQVVERWQQLFKGTVLTQRFLRGELLDNAERRAVQDKVDLWRQRLADISWFVRCTNEWLAREANVEDRCSGRFWEGRFKSQALLDEKALAACMAYVDLNPVRAAMAKTPEQSAYTSVQKRCSDFKSAVKHSYNPENIRQQTECLMPFAGNPRQKMPKGLPFKLRDYLELVDWTGRQVRDDKRGSIDGSLPTLLCRIDISPKHWLTASTQFESKFKGLVGALDRLRSASLYLNLNRSPGAGSCKLLV